MQANDDYYQSGGTLASLDNNVAGKIPTNCTLVAGPQSNGTVTIAGGTVVVNAQNSGYSYLSMNCSDLNLNGQLQVAIAANNPPQCDYLNVSGTTNIQKNSTLTLIVNNGPPAAMKQWAVIQDGAGNIVLPAGFQMPIATKPITPGLNDKVDPANAKQYIVTS